MKFVDKIRGQKFVQEVENIKRKWKEKKGGSKNRKGDWRGDKDYEDRKEKIR